MRKALLSIPSAAGLLLLSTQFAFAATDVKTCPEGQFSVLCNFTSASFGPIVGIVINILFVIAVIIALVFLIYGGIKWIISGGDKSALDSARNHIVAAIIGLIIVFLAYFVIQVILGFFGLSIAKLTLPTLKIQ
ncbi:MAG: hypothetical protein M1444_04410 [Patescibacteria group bacterium]|nr:hypothetical protein [Patescibacteria group bacterium]